MHGPLLLGSVEPDEEDWGRVWNRPGVGQGEEEGRSSRDPLAPSPTRPVSNDIHGEGREGEKERGRLGEAM